MIPPGILLMPVALLLLCVCVARGRPVEVVVLATGDLHGRILSPLSEQRWGGLAAVLPVINRERERHPNTLLVDCGNALAGGGFESRLFPPASYAGMMQAAGYRALLPGWRDWPVLLADQALPDEVPWLTANVTPGGKALTRQGGRPVPYIVLEVGGIQVALVGLMAQGVHLCHPAGMLDDLHPQDPIEALGAWMPELRRVNPEVIVVLLDAGPPHQRGQLGLVRRMARLFPEVHAVVANAPLRERRIGTLYYAAAPLTAGRIIRLSITYDTAERAVTKVQSSLLFSDWQAPAHPPAGLDAGIFAHWRQKHGSTLATVPARETAWEADAFLAAAVQHALETDASLLPESTGDGRPLSGNVRVADLLCAFPENHDLDVLSLTAAELLDVLEELYDHEAPLWVLDGLQFVPGDKEGRAPRVLMADGTPPHARRRHRVALPREVVASQCGRYTTLRQMAQDPLVRLEQAKEDAYDALVRYLRNQEGEATHDGE